MAADVLNYVTPGYWTDGYTVALSSVTEEIQKLAPSAIIEMFEIDASVVGGSVYRFHAGKNNLFGDLIWNGLTYNAFPMEVTGFEWSGKGQLPRPTMTVSNVLGTVTALVLIYDDLAGCKVTRIRTLAKFLDTANFAPRRNLLPNSNTFTSWSNVSATLVKVGSQLDAFGGNDAWLLTDNYAGSDGAGMEQFVTGLTPSLTTQYTFSIYVKKIDYDRIDLYAFFTGASTKGSRVRYTFSTGVLQAFSADGGGAVPTSVTATAQGNGYVRISFSLADSVSGLNTTTQFRIYPVTRDTGPIGSIYASHAQVEIGGLTDPQIITGTTFSANPTADPTAEFARDIYYIDRKSAETRDTVQFELAAALDLAGISLPRRQVIQNYCPWTYRSAECGYTGTSYFDTSDVSVGTLAQDVCGKRLTSCRARFGQYAELPYGGFPAAGLLKV